MARDFGIGNAEPHLLGPLIEAGLGDHFAEHLAVEAERLRLFRRQRMADLGLDLLHPILIGLAELGGRDFGRADFGQRRLAEAVENVVDAPDRETAGEKRHDHAHDGAAEPVFGGFANTSKHVSNAFELMPVRPG